MNPPTNQSHEALPNVELPAPMPNPNVQSGGSAEALPAQPEMGRPAAAERGHMSQSAAASAAATPLPMPADPSISSSQDDVMATMQSMTLSAVDDPDLIEKEWINKAKAIVENNREDPYKQSEQLTLVKADYMKKRYNKTIKLSQ